MKKVLLFFFLQFCIFAEIKIIPTKNYFWTDEDVVFKVYNYEKDEILYRVKVINEDGWGKVEEGKVKIKDNEIRIKPIDEGINIFEFPEKEVRILAIKPPDKINIKEIKKTLPNTWKKLISGKEYKILAMGDSVTQTLSSYGGYEKILAMYLERATGNKNIKTINKGYPGRSVDAAVRFFKEDVIETEPDLSLLMYGLNDEACGYSICAYIESYEYIGKRIKNQLNSDIIFLQPTPHIEIDFENLENSNPPNFIFRTIVFADSIKQLGQKLNIPVAETFHYIWGKGGKSLIESARNMMAFYPVSYRLPFSSLIEKEGNGDKIHPNVIGHLKMAKAIYDLINGKENIYPLKFEGKCFWNENKLKSSVYAINKSDKEIKGTLFVYPPYYKMKIEGNLEIKYSLKPGEKLNFEVIWKEILKPEDLLDEPYIRYFESNKLYLVIVDFSENLSHVYTVSLPFYPDIHFVKERMESYGDVNLKIYVDGKFENYKFKIDENKDSGRIRIIKKIKDGFAIGELVFVRYGMCLKGEANIDGKIEEWNENKWINVGEKFQVGWPEYVDYRNTIDECYTNWAFKSGDRGLYIAIKAKGKITGDSFTIFFDSRNPDEFGKVGRYYWANGKIEQGGKVYLSKGETTKNEVEMKGVWKEEGDRTNIEIFIPYNLFEKEKFPESKELAISIWWRHISEKNKITNIYWSEVGHPWNPRWYGVIKLIDNPVEKLPYMVRMR